ncbi:hypothetical protein C8F04DRAFT_1214235 [Mycena alexandri]|uniref:PIN domain-containing protein n=1 Tax=Mycena alexandri TaxID=1745969 RepID=A0AAD6S3J3_9AGAR|nr:hypothetical protein C8F04DRAFT_1214235 [Mycena alexandri]
MSRALGAAFLNHQVEQLEKSAASGNWRSRTPPKRGNANNTNVNAASGTAPARGSPRKKTAGVLREYKERERKREGRREDDEKDADVVVVDASVLVHALHQVKRWCREGRTEVVIVPLEALNTLDLLKKGSSLLAQRARAASRLLEAQVGANLRIRVQRDDAFVLWDGITFSAASPTGPPAAQDSISISATETAQANVGAGQTPDDPAPEWVRRTVCCARWEVEDAAGSTTSASTTASSDAAPLDSTPTPTSTTASDATPARTVVLAVLSPSASSAPAISGVGVIGTAMTADAAPPNKHEPRASGTLVGRWAARAGVRVLAVSASSTNAANAGTQGPGARDGQASAGTPTSASRPRANTGSGAGGSSGGGGSLVERPPALLAMEQQLQHKDGGGPRVVRLLARGERLDGLGGA